MEERHSLLSALDITPNAKRILNDYSRELDLLSQKEAISLEDMNRFFEDRIYYTVQDMFKEPGKGEKRVDAEIIMEVLRDIGDPENLITQFKSVSKKHKGISSPLYRKLYRSRQEKLVAGVCGGIAEYFQIDPVLVRGAFLVCCIMGGLTALLYPILWFILPLRPKETKTVKQASIFTQVSPESCPAPTQVSPQAPLHEGVPVPKKSFLGKIFGFFSFVFLTVCFYFPATLVLLGATSFCIWGIFYPIVNVDAVEHGFQFSFSDLGNPGVAMAIFASILCFCLFLLVITFMSRLHFRTKVLGKNSMVLVILMVVISLFGAISSCAMIVFQNRVEVNSSFVKNFPLPGESDTIEIGPEHLNAFKNNEIQRTNVKIRTEEGVKGVAVRLTLKARGEYEEQARKYLEDVKVNWPEKLFFPELQKQGKGFHFEEGDIEVTIPAGKNLIMKGTIGLGRTKPSLHLDGKFANVTLDMESTHLWAEKLVASSLNVNHKAGVFWIYYGDIKQGEINIQNNSSFVCKDLKYEQLNIENDSRCGLMEGLSGEKLVLNNHRDGDFLINNCKGILEIKNQGKLCIKGYHFSPKSENSIDNANGYISILIDKKETPQLKVKNEGGDVKNLLKNSSSTDVILEINNTQGKILLAPLYGHRRD